jgi:hypothetical protein
MEQWQKEQAKKNAKEIAANVYADYGNQTFEDARICFALFVYGRMLLHFS